MFADPEVDAVQCFRGGYGSAQLIPHLDFDVIGSNPKAFVGYSDITSLHESIRQRTGLATYYGPSLRGIAQPGGEFTRERLLAVLTGGGQGEVPGKPDDPYVRTIRGGRATGPLVGATVTATYVSGPNYPAGTVVNTTTTTTGGVFKVWALLPGTYTLTFSFTTAANVTETSTVNNVVVTANANTDVGAVVLI